MIWSNMVDMRDIIVSSFSALLAICAGNSPPTSEFPAQRPETRSFDVFFDLRLNKRLRKIMRLLIWNANAPIMTSLMISTMQPQEDHIVHYMTYRCICRISLWNTFIRWRYRLRYAITFYTDLETSIVEKCRSMPYPGDGCFWIYHLYSPIQMRIITRSSTSFTSQYLENDAY